MTCVSWWPQQQRRRLWVTSKHSTQPQPLSFSSSSSSSSIPLSSTMSYKKNEDLDSGPGGSVMDKMTVFQDCIAGFNSSPIQPRRCRGLLTKLAYLLSTGDTFARDESTTLFFSITKLFQHKDIALRQMVYLVIKELAQNADDVIMVTSSIMKDTTVSSDVVYRPNAIRTLARIIDVSSP